MVGAALMAFLAALHYWWPKMFGRRYHEGWGLVAATLIILGFNATFIPQFLLGNNGMPRRYYTYPEHYRALNVASTAGATPTGPRWPAAMCGPAGPSATSRTRPTRGSWW